MNKPVVVHVITNFAGVGGAEMMLSRFGCANTGRV